MAKLILLNPLGGNMARRRSSSRRSSGRGAFSRPLTLLQPAAIGGLGALAINGLVNYAPLPATLKVGNTVFLTRGVLAVLLGMFGSKLPIIGRYAADMAKGSLIVTIADFGKTLALAQGVNLSGLGFINPGRVVSIGPKALTNGNRSGAGMYVPPGRVGMYVQPGRTMAGLGRR